MISELDRVILNADFPEEGLRKGDIGTVVMVYAGGKGFEVEFVALTGETVAVVTATADQLREIQEHEIARVRSLDVPLAA